MTKKIGYIVAAVVILVAILVAVSRLMLPILDKHRADFENWASALLELPVTIKQVHVSWYRYQPEISLDNVTVLNKQTKDPILQIEKVSVFFSIAQSIWQWKLVPDGIMVSGADIDLFEKSNGEFSIQGYSLTGGFNNQPYKSETKFADVVAWLAEQPRLIVNNIDLRYTNAKGLKRFLTLYNLRFENNSTKHVILGKALLHQKVPTEVTVTVHWQGESAALDKINANIYLSVSGLSLAQWWQGYIWNGWQINAGVANAKLWALWNGGAFQKIQCNFESYGLDLYSTIDKSTHKINRLSADVGWKREGNKQIFAGDDVFIDLPAHLWPSTSFYLAMAPDATGQLLPTAINLGYVDLADAQTFLFSSPTILPDTARRLLSDLKLQGDIQSISAIFPATPLDWSHVALMGTFSHLSGSAWHRFPGIKNLSGTVKWNGSEGDLSLHSNQTVLQYDSIFANSILIDQLSGDVIWRVDNNQNWSIAARSLQVLNNDLAMNINGTLTVPATGPISSDLNANFTMQQVNHVTRYLPMRTFDPGLTKWLRDAFISGTIKSGTAIIKGALADFPFDQGNGRFEITAIPTNLTFRFAPDWPVLKNLNAKLVFVGRDITIDVSHAEIEKIPISQVHAVIPGLGGEQATILQLQTGPINTDFALGLQFVHASPLEKTIGKMFADTKVQGPITLKLALTVPLANPDNTTVKGDIAFKSTTLNLVPWNLVIDKLQGQLAFTEKTTDAQNIHGVWFNSPVQLNLQTIMQSKSASFVRATAQSNLSILDLEHWLKLPFSSVAQGATDVATSIDFSLDKPIEVHLSSNLLGVALNLPDNYSKKADESKAFAADIIIKEKEPLRVRMKYGDVLGAALLLDRKQDKFNLIGANIRLGSGDATWPDAGLYITGNLQQLDWDKIKKYSSQSPNKDMPNLKLMAIDVTIAKLSLPGQVFSNMRIQAKPSDNDWDIHVNNGEIIGQLTIPVNFTPQSLLTAQFEKLSLLTAAKTDSIAKIDIKSLPALSFNANNVVINQMKLGQLSFKTSPSKNGLIIQSFSVVSSRVELKSSGDWTASGTRLQGSASSSNVTELLSSLGFDVHNLVSSKGHFDFNLNWRAAPYALTLASMSGRASLNLGSGRIVELSETNGAKMDLGRMLSIFSLQTIPRRLNLDFSDVFQKGYSFDSFKGDFKFENGNAFTDNTRFDGPVARVDIYGRIGLAAKDYDFTLSVTPYVTSSMPVAATLITGQPVVGIAVWAVDKVISSGVTQATTYYYSVRGSWSNPQWNSVATPRRGGR